MSKISKEKYVIGIDFGTLSARGLLLQISNGKVINSVESKYKHGVMDERIPCGIKLESNWALQEPQDYIDSFIEIIQNILLDKKLDPNDIVGIGTDFTVCTMIPIKKDGTPLCHLEQFKNNPHSYAKLWKHHSAQKEADLINKVAIERNEVFLSYYGNKISSEWILPKVLQIINEAPNIYDETDLFIEAADWITLILTGNEKRSSCPMGYKALWHKRNGFPSKIFFKELNPKLENFVEEKFSNISFPLGTFAGKITKKISDLTGLNINTSVSVGCGDAHAAFIGAGITNANEMLMVLGTSGCDMMVTNEEIKVPGMCGICEDGILPGFFGYEAGQSCVGDHFMWFADNCVPYKYFEEAEKLNVDILTYITSLAKNLEPGESGLIALDWWNGNRSVLMDADLSGVIVGLNLNTKSEEIYRSLVEAVAFGKRKIIETFEQNNVPINKLYATGGIAEKNDFIMQILSDILQKEIYICEGVNVSCIGSAMMASVAVNKTNSEYGYKNLLDAIRNMSNGYKKVFLPNKTNKTKYDLLYKIYMELHDFFGIKNDILKKLKQI